MPPVEKGERQYSLDHRPCGALGNPYAPYAPYAGTGLSVALTKHSIEGQGGDVSVKSAPGTGDMSLPAATAFACTVLVVEDNPTGRRLLRLILEAEGYRVVEAFDGATALKRMERDPPDLVIQDLILPDIDGLELLRRMRALPAGAHVPVLALSGFRSILENAAHQAGGFDECLLKPILPSRLVEIVRRYIPLPDPVASDLGKGRHVLVVDDDAIQLRLAALRLRQLGFRVSTSSDAVGAIALAVSSVPDLILSDVLMPDVDGFQLCQRARHEPLLARVPIVLWSAHHQDEADHVLALRVGAGALLSRSDDFKEVVAAVVAAMDRRLAANPSDALAGALAGDARNEAAVYDQPISVTEQLTRQAAAHASLTRRCALHAAQLAIIGGVADALSRSQDVDAVLDDILAACLDAGGITRGALYRVGAGGMLAVEQALGFAETDVPELDSCFGHRGLLDEVKMGQTVLPSRFLRDTEVRSLLHAMRATALVIVPLAIAEQCTGALLLASDLPEIGEE
ncbi:MAG: response regulator, partial [Myxococcales bacterium]